jgi:very-short-patch-repair endonuclease
MALPFNRNLKAFAGELRRMMTDAERTLWSKLRRKQLNGLIFYRQKTLETTS